MGGSAERNQSLWMTTDRPQARYAALDHDVTADVVVVGAGITGLTAAYLLKRDGARVAVIERDFVGTGVTGFTTGKVTSLHGLVYASLARRFSPEVAAIYGEANEAGVDAVARIASELGIDCDLRRMPAFTYTETGQALADVEQEVEAAQRAGLPAGFTSECDLPFPIRGAVRFDDQVHFHPRRYCVGLAKEIGDVYEHTEATGVDQDNDGVVVRTRSGELRADHVILATQLPFVHRGLFYAKAAPHRSYAVAAPYDAPPEGMYLSAEEPTRSVRPVLSGDQSWLIVGGESHKVGQEPDTPARYAAIDGWMAERFGVGAQVRWSAEDFMPADGVPYIGRASSGTDRMWVATGFKKWGMSTGTFAAIIISDLIAGRDNAWAPVFDSTRVDLRRSARTLVKENVDVAKRFVGGRIDELTAPSIDELAVGQGDIVHNGSQRVAAYHDEAGVVHQVSPLCTHMGCVVAFNSAERSWDCPCHGSRFTVDGEVLQGPATAPLRRMERDDEQPAAG